jgi:hypothetical protein
MTMKTLIIGVCSSLLACAVSGNAEDIYPEGPLLLGEFEASSLGGAHGAAVAVSGELAVVGRPLTVTPGGTGVVDVYQRSPLPATLDGVPWEWSLLCRLEPGNDASSDSRFGASVDIDGTTVVVGAWSDDTEGDNAGSAWVFSIPENPPAVLMPTSQLVPSELSAGDYFGWAVGIQGDVIAVGAWGVDTDDEENHAGAVWVFERSDDEFTETAMLISGDEDAAGERLGSSIEVLDGVILAGAPARSDWSGAVYWFGKESDTWSLDQRIDSPEGDAWEEFGRSITFGLQEDGSLGGIAIGAPGDGELGAQAGAAWIFDSIVDGHLDQSQFLKVTAPGGGPLDRTGTALAVFESGENEGGGLLLGAPGWRTPDEGVVTGALFFVSFDGEDDDGEDDQGRVVLPFMEGAEEGAGIGMSLAAAGSTVSGWGIKSTMVVIGLPGGSAGLGNVQFIDVPTQHGELDLDCNGNGLLDQMELLLLPTEVDCNGDGVIDACQLQNNDCNQDGILDECQLSGSDCNQDGILDGCQLNGGTDCNVDNILDECQIDIINDCNSNGRLDTCDLNYGHDDCNEDGVLDECQSDASTDCNGNGLLDICDLAGGAADCNGDGVLDECQVDGGTDCNGDGVPDTCQIYSGNDCNDDGILDECQLDGGSDCDADGVLDVCQLNADPMADCDMNGVLDVCDFGGDPGLDCDNNATFDACQILSDPAYWDCDGNGLLDVCEIMADPETLDCDGDNVLDACTLASNPGSDCDDDGILDACQELTPPVIPAIWFTQQFVDGVDLAGLGIRLSPTGNSSPPFYQLCTVLAENVWLDPTGHAVLPLADDQSSLQYLPFQFQYAGETWNDVYIGSNGNVTFGTSDISYVETLASHFALKRLSVLFTDLNPEDGGQVLYGTGPLGSAVVTWNEVPEYDVLGSSNTAQLVLHPDGAIEMSWQAITTPAAIVGASMGFSMGPGFVQTDLSNSFDCVTRGLAPDGDCNENGVADICESVPAGNPWWGTEHFAGDFDLSQQMVRWQPNGSSTAPRWQVCSETIHSFPVDPIGGTAISMMDDDSYLVPIGFPFPFADQIWTEVYIGSNGYLTFGTADFSYEDSLFTHFQLPRISGLMTDLSPDIAGEIRVQQGPAGSLVVTWLGVPIYGLAEFDVDMQILLHPNGAVEIAWLDAVVFSAIVGISEGILLPMGFSQTDLSAAGSACEIVRAFDDCDGSGISDEIEIALGCLIDYDFNGIPDLCEGGGVFAGLPGRCPHDVTADGRVDVRDLLEVLYHWGPVKFGSFEARCDFVPTKGDQQVDVDDLVEIIYAMQAGCGQPS